jgi:polyisoprenoid-binding protein YceI
MAAALTVIGWNPSRTSAQGAPGQGQGAGGRGAAAAPTGPPTASKLDLSEGTRARYRVQENLAGLNVLSDAVGTTEAVTGTILLGADNSINSSQSKLTVDLRTLKSDQELRDGYLQRVVLQTDKFPLLEFVPRRAVGLPSPLPAAARPQVIGFQLIGDLTLHGVTSEITWSVVGTVTAESVAGRATTTLPFSTYGLSKTAVPLVLSVDDKINLEVEFRCKRTPL